LLCDEGGEPVSTEVFKGNTQDPATFGSQVRKAAELFGCERVTFVGDRGMIKSAQVEELAAAGFHYITAITKPQIETLLKSGIVQMELFDQRVCEVEHEGLRYILRRNPTRADELAATRADKRATLERLVEERNRYLAEHRRAKVATAQKAVREKLATLKIDSWLSLKTQGRTLRLQLDENVLEQASLLDGCYVIKTDLPKKVAGTQTIHDRYKDLTRVEQAFRTCKTAHLEVRPIFVRSEPSTRGHVLVVMLAYLIRQRLSRAWASFDFTVEEGLDRLKTLCAMEVKFETGIRCLKLPEPRDESLRMLKALGIRLPHVLPKSHARVSTHKKLQQRRKTR
jgi:transposase